MPQFPLEFTASAQASANIADLWTTTSADEKRIECSIPKEFGGPNSGVSPEDLYLMALMNCYIATFKVIASNSKITFESLEAKGQLTLDRTPENTTPWMKYAKLVFTATTHESEDRFLRIMERVSRQCMIINSVKSTVEFEFHVRTV